MRQPQSSSQAGWTLLELLLVLVCVAGLTAILLYSFVTPTNRQASIRQVVSQISLIVDAAHLWRHDPNNNHNYQFISMKGLQDNALIDVDFNSNSPNTYDVNQYSDTTLAECKNDFSCIEITVKNLPKACQYVDALSKAGSVSTFPNDSYCINHPDANITSFKVIYD